MDLREISLADIGRRLRSSYWFVPALMMAGGVALSFGFEHVDHWLANGPHRSLPGLARLDPDGARAIFSTIATAMVTVVSVTFSMTMVAVSYAAGQIGPRLVQNFMRDRINQVTLGVFIGTFVYCLLGLRTVRGTPAAAEGAEVFVPEASLLLAMGLAVACVATFIHFVHHIPEKINVGRITAELGFELKRDLAVLFPEPKREGESADPEVPSILDADPPPRGRAVPSVHDGYIEAVDLDGLTAFAASRDLELRLEYRPGDFANEDDVLLRAFPADRVEDADVEAIRPYFSFGRERTPTQNVLFLVDQLVEILAKALSPGVNDPFTALNCTNWLGSALAATIARPEAEPCRFDGEGRRRIVVHPVRFADLADAIFDQSRQYVATDRNASLDQMRILAEAILRANDQDRRTCLLEHARALERAARERLPLGRDRDAVTQRLDVVEGIANDPALAARLIDEQGWLGGTA